ncbi:MAG: transglutaminase family protein, partial [Nevskiales bacterium]
DPEGRIRALNTVIYLHEGIRYDHSPDARSRQEYYFLNGILDTKRGICYTMPLLYMAVAQRLGYPIYPVAAPDHLFLRYASYGFREQNIEATSGGKYIPDATYIRNFAVSQRGLESGSYLRTLSYREFLGYLLGANAVIQARRRVTPATLALLEKAAELDPKTADHYDRLYTAHLEMSQRSQGKSAEGYRKKAIHYARKARELGYVHPDEITQARRIRGQ